MINIRKATINDLTKVTEIEEACFPKEEAATRNSMELRIRSFSDSFWILEKDYEIISFIDGMYSNNKDLLDEMYEGIDLYSCDGDWLMIFGVDTLPSYQHGGYASYLMEMVIEEVRREGHKGIVLTCKDRLISFYEKFGFKNEGISTSTHGNVVWYQMRLKVK